ncbi:hypothetical protein [Paraburkholderia sp. BL6665CI2N2]|nr:hypothetical protein [Paraburkholderia sp. BL6665CI2N2]
MTTIIENVAALTLAKAKMAKPVPCYALDHVLDHAAVGVRSRQRAV